MAACASGDVEDARRGAELEAEEGASLPAQQATYTVQRFFGRTPTPAPTRAGGLVLSALTLTLNLGADGAPSEEYAAVATDAGTVYVAARISGLRRGQAVAGTLATADGTVIATSTGEAALSGEQWVALPFFFDGSLSPGEYAVAVIVDDDTLNSLVVRLLPPGSRPLRGSDLPAVTLRPTQPAAGPTFPAGQPTVVGGSGQPGIMPIATFPP